MERLGPGDRPKVVRASLSRLGFSDFQGRSVFPRLGDFADAKPSPTFSALDALRGDRPKAGQKLAEEFAAR